VKRCCGYHQRGIMYPTAPDDAKYALLRWEDVDGPAWVVGLSTGRTDDGTDCPTWEAKDAD
jgi:hypothetical protein